jgi:hypothetical protein
MNVLAPVRQPVFRWNNNQVMAEGGRGLARHLGIRLLAIEDDLGGQQRARRAAW